MAQAKKPLWTCPKWRVEMFGPKSYGLHFRLTRPEDLDEKLAALVREAYAVGC